MGCPFFRSKSKDDLMERKKRKTVMIGLDNAGKTTILNSLKCTPCETTPTVGLNVETITLSDLELLIFDIGGRANNLWGHYFDNLDSIIFVIDSTDRERLLIVKQELIKLCSNFKCRNIPLLIFFNKQDCENCIDDQDLIDESGINEIVELDVVMQKCSAKLNEGVIDGFEKVVKMIKKKESEITSSQSVLESSKSFRFGSLIKGI